MTTYLGIDLAWAEKARTGLAALVLLPVASLALAGCFGVYDAASPTLYIENAGGEAVVVTIVRTVETTQYAVGGHASTALDWADDCLPAEVTVETERGDRIGRLEDDLCPGWKLTITEDGELGYERA